MNKIKLWFQLKRSSIKYKYSFLKVLNSPFVGLKLKCYFGEIVHGTPYFLPRKWVKATPKLAHEATVKSIEDDLNYNKRNPQYARKIKSYDEVFEGKMRCLYPIPIKYFDWHFTTLGWKTKWEEYRYEWTPSLSVVIFGKQLFIQILPSCDPINDILRVDCYWESWLNWEYNTDKSKSKKERFEELIKKHSNTWGSKEEWTDYYLQILNKKYLKLYKKLNNDK